MTIGDLLRSSNLTKEEIHRVESALHDRDAEIESRDAEIQRVELALRKREGVIEGNRVELQRKESDSKDQDVAFDSLQREMRQLMAELGDVDERKRMQDGLLRLVKQLIEQKSVESERLRTRLSERDEANEQLYEQLQRIGMANQTEIVAIANQISAQKTLEMVSGLRRDIAERDESIRAGQRELSSKDEEIQFLKQRIEQMEEQAREFGSEVEGAKREAADAKKEAKEARGAVERLEWKVQEGNSIAEEQQDLIKRLLRRPLR